MESDQRTLESARDFNVAIPVEIKVRRYTWVPNRVAVSR